MLVYRIGKTKYAKDLTGEGAKLNGGRWNHPGLPCIYTGESRALSLLEYSARASSDTIPRALSFTIYNVPGDSILELRITQLPGNRNEWPHPKETRDLGSKLLSEKKFLLIKIPSVIIPDEFIYVINPLHAKMKEVRTAAIRGLYL